MKTSNADDFYGIFPSHHFFNHYQLVILQSLIGFILSVIFKKLRLPNIIGLLITGIILGPYVFDLISPDILNISLDLRQIGLVIILLRAGLSLNIHI